MPEIILDGKLFFAPWAEITLWRQHSMAIGAKYRAAFWTGIFPAGKLSVAQEATMADVNDACYLHTCSVTAILSCSQCDFIILTFFICDVHAPVFIKKLQEEF